MCRFHGLSYYRSLVLPIPITDIQGMVSNPDRQLRHDRSKT